MADHGLTAAQRLPSPSAFMKTLYACGEWRYLAHGRTWPQLLARLRSRPPVDFSRDVCTYGGLGGPTCFCDISPVSLLSLPLDAWKDAIRAAIEADNG